MLLLLVFFWGGVGYYCIFSTIHDCTASSSVWHRGLEDKGQGKEEGQKEEEGKAQGEGERERYGRSIRVRVKRNVYGQGEKKGKTGEEKEEQQGESRWKGGRGGRDRQGEEEGGMPAQEMDRVKMGGGGGWAGEGGGYYHIFINKHGSFDTTSVLVRGCTVQRGGDGGRALFSSLFRKI